MMMMMMMTIMMNGKKVKRKRGKVTTGKLGIDLERSLVIHGEKDPSIWHTEVDPRDIEDAKKYAAPERKALKANVRSSIDSLISGAKARSVRGARRPSLADSPPPSAETMKNLRFNLPENNKQTEKSITGGSIQPSGTYPLGRSLSSSPRSSPDPSSFGEQSWPVRFNINIGCLQDRGDLLWGDSHVVISKDEGSIDTGKFRRHDDDKYAQVSCEDLAL